MSDAHAEHWMEPLAVTQERPLTEKFCENCGEEVPWHKASCKMLKNAYKRRYAKCYFCVEEHIVGEKMASHTQDNHPKELEEMGIK